MLLTQREENFMWNNDANEVLLWRPWSWKYKVGVLINSGLNNYSCLLQKIFSWKKSLIDDLVQGCNNSIALAMELLQTCAKPSICDLI